VQEGLLLRNGTMLAAMGENLIRSSPVPVVEFSQLFL